VAIILFALWHALARTNLGSRQRLLGWTAVAAALALWLAFVWTHALQERFLPEPGAPRVLQIVVVLVPMIILIISALTLLTRSQTIAAAVDAAPLWWLIAYQMSHVNGGVIFLLLWYYGFLPGFFALPAGIGDTLTGLFAIVAVVALCRDAPLARPLGYAVNVFGMADLIYANQYGRDECACVDHGRGIADRYVSAGHGSNLWSSACFCSSLSIWQLRRRGRVEFNGQFATQKS
jgi:hypothetical protein